MGLWCGASRLTRAVPGATWPRGAVKRLQSGVDDHPTHPYLTVELLPYLAVRTWSQYLSALEHQCFIRDALHAYLRHVRQGISAIGREELGVEARWCSVEVSIAAWQYMQLPEHRP